MVDEFEYLDSVDRAILTFFKEADRQLTVADVQEALNGNGFSLDRKRVRNKLNSLVKYSYLESVIETKDSGGYRLRFLLKKVTA